MYSIVPITPQDVATIALHVWTSKQSLTINRVLFKDWPNEAAQKAVYAAGVESQFKNPQCQTWKAVDDESGEIVGHVVLTRNQAVSRDSSSEGNDRKQDEKEIPSDFRPEVFKAVTEAFIEINKVSEELDHFGK